MKKFSNIEVVFLVVITSIISLLVGYNLSNKTNNSDVLNEFIKTYNNIRDNYYEKIDDKEILNGAVNGMLSVLDEHTTLIDKDENENFYLTLNGAYNGIGVEVTKTDDNIVIVGVISDSPASKAGLKEGDIIKKVDDIDLYQKETKVLSNYIRKESKKDEFNLVIDRDGEELQFNIKKQNVIITSVLSKTFEREDKKIGYIYISIFSNTTASQFNKKLTELEDSGIDALIIDVRENSGGHLSTAISILSMLLDDSKVIYKIDKKGEISSYYSMGKKSKKYPIAIVQNNGSASASELLAISLRDNLNALVVGDTSYGKGTVQETDYLSTGNMYKYTTKKWLSPKGTDVEGVGVKPDVSVSLDMEYYSNPSDDTDNQLNTALDKIVEKIK